MLEAESYSIFRDADLRENIKLIGIVAGAIFALYQYYKAQEWKKSEFASSILQQLSDHPDLVMCCTFLDWSSRKIAVPDKYRIFTNELFFRHDWSTMTEALRPENERANFDFPLIMYRDAFDRFFTYLALVDHYISIGLFRERDVSSLAYWLEEIRSPRHALVNGKNVKINPFPEFIKHYHYAAVEHLIEKFERKRLIK